MNDKVNIQEFIDTYRKFYFKEGIDGRPASEDDKGVVGIQGLNQTENRLEKYIVNKLKNGIYDVEVFAWKAGKAKSYTKDDVFVYNAPWPDELITLYGGKIIRHADTKIDRKKIKAINAAAFDTLMNELLRNLGEISSYNLGTPNGRKKLYKEIFEKSNIDNWGTVNIINYMFFRSQGQVPLYDKFSHKAIRALYENESPSDIFLNAAADKTNVEQAMVMYEEYIRLLHKVFNKEDLKKNVNKSEYEIPGMMISRELDQALWVYGHATKKFQ